MARFNIQELNDKQRQLLAAALAKEVSRKAPVPASNVESSVGHEQVGAGKVAPFDTPTCIHVHSVRKRLTDADGVSAKAAIDGLVHAGVLYDDDPSHVRQVTFSQEQGEPEETIITITSVDR